MIERRPEGKIVGPIAASVVSTRLYGNIKLVGVNHAAVLVHLLLVVVNVVLVLALPGVMAYLMSQDEQI